MFITKLKLLISLVYLGVDPPVECPITGADSGEDGGDENIDELEEEWSSLIDQRYGPAPVSLKTQPQRSSSTAVASSSSAAGATSDRPPEQLQLLEVYKGVKDRIFQRNADGSTKALGPLAMFIQIFFFIYISISMF